MSRHIKIVLNIVGALGLAIYFQNCASGLPDNLSQNSQSQSSSPSPGPTSPSPQPPNISLPPLYFSVSPTRVAIGQNANLAPSGGVPPYHYMVISGPGAVSGTSVASQAAGALQVEVVDSANQTAVASLSVVNGSAGTGASCTTAWGAVIPDGNQAIGYSAASVECPASCQAETLTCVNGSFTGASFAAVSPSCSVASCVYKIDTIAACPVVGVNNYVLNFPGTCVASQYHSELCLFNNSTARFEQYLCASPSESVSTVDDTPPPPPPPFTFDGGGG